MTYKKITIADIAKDLNLSTSTVSRAMSGKGRISKETVQRVLDYVEKANYSPNIIAKSLVNSKTYNLMFVLPSDQNIMDMPFFQNCLLGATEIAEEYNYDILVITQREDDISNLQRVVRNNKVDGVILSRAFEDDKAIHYLKEIKIPFVLIGDCNDKTITNVDSKHEDACHEITAQLIQDKNSTIGLIGGNMKNTVNSKRLKGFQRAIEEKNIYDNRVYTYLNVENSEYINIIVEEFLSNNVDYIFCMDDYICSKVINKFENIESYLYKKVQLVSFYSNAYIENHNPSVSRLKFDVRGLGVTACLDLIEQIENKTIATHKLLGYEIIL